MAEKLSENDSEDQCPHSKQRIFLSIDVIGSTKLKSSLSQPAHTSSVWANEFAVFLPKVVDVYWNKFVETVNKHCPGNCKHKCISGTRLKKEDVYSRTVNVWKYIGDEVVLTAELVCNQVSLYVLALAETIKHFNNDFERKPLNDDPDNIMQIKGTAWVAGFPVDNIELDLPSTGGHKVRDYLGPLIDLGFRLSRFASKDRLIISASLAFFIASESDMKEPIVHMNEQKYRLPLCFGGIVEVKGVKDGKHPLIWYSVMETKESKLGIVEHNELLTFLKNIHFKGWTYFPFIPVSGGFHSDYMKDYKEAVEAQKKIPGSPFTKIDP